MTEQNELEKDATPNVAEEKVSARTKQAMDKIAEGLSRLWNEAQQEDLEKLAVQFEEFANKLWVLGSFIKTYDLAIEITRRHGYKIENPLPLTEYKVHSDPAHDDFRVELYSHDKILMTLIFKPTTRRSKLPFKVTDFRFYKQSE